jgi:thioredoxin-like negative regulator of GroEL
MAMNKNKDKPVLMFFYREIHQEGVTTFNQLRGENPLIASFITVNVQENPEVAKTFSIEYTPTLLVVINGKEYWRHVGGFTPEYIKNNLALFEPINREAFL